MRKLVKLIASFFRAIYRLIDKGIVTPISRIIYNVNNYLKNHNGGLDKLLNRPNVLLYASLALAIIVFLLIDSRVITLVESEAEVITNIPVTVKYNEEAYVVEGIPDTVDMILTGRKSDIYLAKQLGEHEVILDLTDYTASSTPYKVYLNYTKSIDSLSYKLDPSYVSITISNKISELSLISYDLLNSDLLDEKLSVESVELSKTEAVVKGSRKALDKIATVKALIDLNNDKLSEAGTYNIDNIPLVAYDSDGIIIKDVEIVPASITATIKLNTHKATVPLSVMTTGDLVTGKAIASILINNNATYSLDIYGEQEEINEIKSVPVTINVEGEGNNSTKSYNVTISKPNGVRSMSASSATISVTFGDEKQKTIELTHRDIKSDNLPEGLSVTASSNTTIPVQVKGVQSVIDSVDASNIYAYIDLSGYSVGDHEVDVKIKSSDPRLKFVVSTKISVKITNAE